MKQSWQGDERIWWIAGSMAVVVLMGIFFLLSFRDPDDTPARSTLPETHAPEIGLTRLVRTNASNLVSAEAEFFDPTPLFLPTKWNSDQKKLPANILRDPGQMFQDFPPRLVFVDQSLSLDFHYTVQIPDKHIDTIRVLDNPSAYSGIGRSEVKLSILAERGAYVEVTQSGRTGKILAEALPDLELPAVNWHPLELVAMIDAAGIIGRLSLVESSGVDEIDVKVREYLVQTVHLGGRLAPGFYRILVGP